MTELHFTPRTQADTEAAQGALDDYTYEWNPEFGCFIFEEEEDLIDALESDLSDLFSTVDVNGRFEVQ